MGVVFVVDMIGQVGLHRRCTSSGIIIHGRQLLRWNLSVRPQFRLLGHRLVNLLPVLIERRHLCPVGFLRQIQPEICCLIHVHATPFT